VSVSDTASVDAAADRSGPTIQDIVRQRGHGCVRSIILPDDEQQIRETVKSWCSENAVDWIISTGGTGFGVRDRTPEVFYLSCSMSVFAALALTSSCLGDFSLIGARSTRNHPSTTIRVAEAHSSGSTLPTRRRHGWEHARCHASRQCQGCQRESGSSVFEWVY